VLYGRGLYFSCVRIGFVVSVADAMQYVKKDEERWHNWDCVDREECGATISSYLTWNLNIYQFYIEELGGKGSIYFFNSNNASKLFAVTPQYSPFIVFAFVRRPVNCSFCLVGYFPPRLRWLSMIVAVKQLAPVYQTICRYSINFLATQLHQALVSILCP